MSWTLIVVLSIGSSYIGTPPPVGITSYTVPGFSDKTLCLEAAKTVLRESKPEEFRNSETKIKATCVQVS